MVVRAPVRAPGMARGGTGGRLAAMPILSTASECMRFRPAVSALADVDFTCSKTSRTGAAISAYHVSAPKIPLSFTFRACFRFHGVPSIGFISTTQSGCSCRNPAATISASAIGHAMLPFRHPVSVRQSTNAFMTYARFLALPWRVRRLASSKLLQELHRLFLDEALQPFLEPPCKPRKA